MTHSVLVRGLSRTACPRRRPWQSSGIGCSAAGEMNADAHRRPTRITQGRPADERLRSRSRRTVQTPSPRGKSRDSETTGLRICTYDPHGS